VPQQTAIYYAHMTRTSVQTKIRKIKRNFIPVFRAVKNHGGGETRPVLSQLSTPDGRCSSDLHSCSLILKEIVSCVQATADWFGHAVTLAVE
jgi:hypothetical protein